MQATVIIPTYNRALHITQALDSVWTQTYRPLEVVVVDDGSTDQTQAVVKEWAATHQEDTFSTRYIYQKNAGAPAARNNGIAHSTGQYLQFLDSDDLLLPEKLALQISLMQQENTAMCICDYVHVDQNDQLLKHVHNHKTINQLISSHKGISTSIGVIDKSFLIKNKICWNPKLKRFQDRDFNRKISLCIKQLSYVDKPLFKWIKHSEDRISTTIHDSIVYWQNFTSLVGFHVKNWKKIPLSRWFPCFFLYGKLIALTIFMPIMNRIPNSVKFWRDKVQ